jgi:hypothetical protein
MSGGIMAKKTGGMRTNRRRDEETQPASFDQRFPTIARWILREDGWIGLGLDHYGRSLARALYGGGMVWEGATEYGSLDEALRAMEAGIAAWLGEYRPDELRGLGTGPGIVGSRTRSGEAGTSEKLGAGERPKAKLPPVTPDRSRPRKQTSPKTTSRSKKDDRTTGNAAPSVPRVIVEKVRKLEEIAEALRQDEHFSITRLTILKGLCKDTKAAGAFALFLARKVQRKLREKEAPKRYRTLVNRAVREMKPHLDEPDEEAKERLYSLLREMEAEQNEYKSISWGMVRIVKSMDLLVAETCVRAVVRSDEAPHWLYHAARDYVERYDPQYGTGLVPSSAPMVEEIGSFWRKFCGIRG